MPPKVNVTEIFKIKMDRDLEGIRPRPQVGMIVGSYPFTFRVVRITGMVVHKNISINKTYEMYSLEGELIKNEDDKGAYTKQLLSGNWCVAPVSDTN